MHPLLSQILEDGRILDWELEANTRKQMRQLETEGLVNPKRKNYSTNIFWELTSKGQEAVKK